MEPSVTCLPAGCGGHDCNHRKSCFRFTLKETGNNSIYTSTCISSGYLFRIEEGSPEEKDAKDRYWRYIQEKHPFSLNMARMTIPTNNSMYDCYFCTEQGKAHQIVNDRAPEKILQRMSHMDRCYATIRRCTGCGRWDGPWLPYGDD